MLKKKKKSQTFAKLFDFGLFGFFNKILSFDLNCLTSIFSSVSQHCAS